MEYITLIFILFAFEYAYFIMAKRLRIVDRPHHQSSHTGIIVRGGGHIVLCSVCSLVSFAWITMGWRTLWPDNSGGCQFY